MDEHCEHKVEHAKRNFLRHFFEMIIISVIGMVVFYGGAYQGGLSLIGLNSHQIFLQYPEIVNMVMAVTMTLPMVGWMFYRGHSTAVCLEMGAVMFIPTVLAIGLFWLHLIPVETTLGLQMILMLPAMILIMLYRNSEYTVHCGSIHNR